MTQSENPPARETRRPRRWWKWVRRVVLTLLALMVVLSLLGWVYVAWANRQGDRAVASVLDQLRQRQLPDSPEKLLDSSPADKRPPGRYLYAAGELATNPPAEYRDLPIVGQIAAPDFGKPIPVELARRLAKFVDDNKDYFGLLDKAQAADERQELLTYEYGSINRLGQLQEAVRRRLAASLANQSAGDANEAIQCCAKALWLGSTFDGQPSIANSPIRGGADALVVSSIERCLSRGQATPQSLRAAHKSLLHEEAAIDFPEIAKADVAIMADMMTNRDLYMAAHTHGFVRAQQAIEKSRREWDATLKSLGAVGPASPDFLGSEVSRDTVRGALAAQWAWAYICPGAYRQLYAEEVQRTLANMDQTAKPEAELAKWAAKAIQADAESQAGVSPTCVRELLAIKALLRAASAALSVELYRIEHGDWPADLAALKDAQIADPFTAQPFKYVRTAQGVLVYSVGKNLSDDGGKDRGSGGDDVVFRLLNPDLRNKP